MIKTTVSRDGHMGDKIYFKKHKEAITIKVRVGVTFGERGL